MTATTEPAPSGEHGEAMQLAQYVVSGIGYLNSEILLAKAYIAQARELAEVRAISENRRDAAVSLLSHVATLELRALAAESALEKARAEAAVLLQNLMRSRAQIQILADSYGAESNVIRHNDCVQSIDRTTRIIDERAPLAAAFLAEVATMKEALKPFAEMGVMLDRLFPLQDDIRSVFNVGNAFMFAGDLRRAATALRQPSGKLGTE